MRLVGRPRLCKSVGLYGGSEPESGGLSGRCDSVLFLFLSMTPTPTPMSATMWVVLFVAPFASLFAIAAVLLCIKASS